MSTEIPIGETQAETIRRLNREMVAKYEETESEEAPNKIALLVGANIQDGRVSVSYVWDDKLPREALVQIILDIARRIKSGKSTGKESL